MTLGASSPEGGAGSQEEDSLILLVPSTDMGPDAIYLTPDGTSVIVEGLEPDAALMYQIDPDSVKVAVMLSPDQIITAAAAIAAQQRHERPAQ